MSRAGEPVLELRDLLAERRRCDAEPGGRGSEMTNTTMSLPYA